ncbi:MAG: serpin family protein [Luteolibacter sp.]
MGSHNRNLHVKGITTIFAASLLGLGLAHAETATPAARELNPDFTPALYQQLKTGEGNVFFSPYSITEAMAMVHAGAGGNTATEIAKALAFGEGRAEDIAKRSEALRAQLAKLNQGENKLRVANALCVTGVPPQESFQKLVRTRYEGEVFSGDLDKINGWVKKKTEGKIEKILDKLSEDSACVILNAVYFKGNWMTPFDAGNTRKAAFHRKAEDPVEVDMMSREDSYPVLQDKGVIAVELLYANGASMVLVMPGKADGMAALEEQLSAPFVAGLCADLRKTQPKEINLSVPKFKVATKYGLIPAMKELGMVDAFAEERADFKAMYDKTPVSIAQIVHKATLEVDEKGSVAAAATAVEIQANSITEGPPEIRFDRPFLVLIRDQATGTTLFMGRINDPTAK